MPGSNSIIVAIPVRNEESRIGACLAAIAAQSQPYDKLVLLLNNCTDQTATICRAAQHSMPIDLVETTLPEHRASAGEARRLALSHAASISPDGIILTTDADATPPLDWIDKNLNAFARGADLVCGQAFMLATEGVALPRGLHFDDMRESFLCSLLDEITALIDPDPADPWPRHQQQSGASLAMRTRCLREAGGAPHVPTGEDRALVARFRAIDAQVRHDPGIKIPVSGRLDGRAVAGMAATMKRRIQTGDVFTDDRLEPAVDAYRRALAKTRLGTCRRGNSGAARLAADLLIHEDRLNEALNAPYFGAAWEMIQALSPVLHRRRVAFTDLARETRQALQLRDSLKAETSTEAQFKAAQNVIP